MIFFLYEWDEDELMTPLILNISRDLLARDACYGCLFYYTMERNMKTVYLSF